MPAITRHKHAVIRRESGRREATIDGCGTARYPLRVRRRKDPAFLRATNTKPSFLIRSGRSRTRCWVASIDLRLEGEEG